MEPLVVFLLIGAHYNNVGVVNVRVDAFQSCEGAIYRLLKYGRSRFDAERQPLQPEESLRRGVGSYFAVFVVDFDLKKMSLKSGKLIIV